MFLITSKIICPYLLVLKIFPHYCCNTYFPHVNFRMNLSSRNGNKHVYNIRIPIYISKFFFISLLLASTLVFYLFMNPSKYSFFPPLYFINDCFIFIWRLFGCVCPNIIPSHFIKIFTVYIRFSVHFEFSRYTIISPKNNIGFIPSFQIFIFTYFSNHILITAAKYMLMEWTHLYCSWL